MGVMCDYFLAPDDAAAAACLDGGPQPPLTVVDAKGIDPVVLLGYVETLCGGRSFDEQLDDDAAGRPVAVVNEGERVVAGISPQTTAVFAGIAHADTPRIAEAWAEAEEFGGTADPEWLAQVLQELCGLARGASETGDQLYCWICV